MKIWGVRHSLAGDMVMALPALNYLEIKYPNSFKYWVIAKKCVQFAPIFFNHPLINQIRITQYPERLGWEDIRIAQSCDVILDVAPQHPDGMPGTTPQSCWWNYYNIFEETFRMAGFDVEEYRKMPEELKYPKLSKWFDIEKNDTTIGIWPFTSYGLNKRSPSLKWWKELVKLLNCPIYQFGGQNDPEIVPEHNRFNDLPIFNQIKLALSTRLCLNTNSGSGIILGAYGHKQVSLLTTNDAPNHIANDTAFAPLNWANNINIVNRESCDNISHEEVLDAIEKLK